MLSFQPITLADLILSRLLLAKPEGLTQSTLKDAVKPIVASQLSASALTEHLAQTLAQLETQGLIQMPSKARFQITENGQQQSLAQLQLTTLPSKAQWKTLKDIDWINYALALPAPEKASRRVLGSADGLRAAILHHGFQLPVDHYSTLTKARNALLWKQLCDPAVTTRLQHQLPQLTTKAFNQGVVMGLLLNDLLQTAQGLPWEKALKQLVAKTVNAKRTDPNELRLAILRQAISESLVQPVADDTLTAAQPSLEEFATAVLDAAAITQTGRFGDNKVFISQVWKIVQQKQPALSASLDDFKQQLLLANRQRLLTLSRADMAYTLDTTDVSASEITYLNNTFHFIRLD